MKILGNITFAVIIALILISLGMWTGNGFIFDFINIQLIGIATTLLGFNIAIHAILAGQISTLEIRMGKLGHFINTRKELKDNAMLNVFLLTTIFFLRIIKIDQNSQIGSFINHNLIEKINYGNELITLTALVLIVMLIIETIGTVYLVYDSKSKTK